MNFRKKIIFFSITILILSFVLYGCPIEPVVNHDSSWLVLVYLDGDNNLEDCAIDDLNEMENALYKLNNKELNILVLFDRASGYDSSNGDWTSTRLYYVQPDSDTSEINSTLLKDYGELNMGDPATLSNFISYAKQNFTYQHLMLILWNHGGGARIKSDIQTNTDSIEKAVCWDEGNSNDCLYLDEVQQALSANFNSANKLDIIGFDACLMGTVEVAYEFRDLASYMVGSMHTEQGDGWDYESLFYGGTTNCPQLDPSSITAADMAIRAVKSYRDFIEANYSSSGETMAAIDLSKLTALKTEIDQLAVSICSENKENSIETIRDSSINFYDNDNETSIDYPYFDLYDFCDRIYNDATYGFSAGLKNAANDVITALSDAILYAYGDDGNGQSYYFGNGATTKRGLSIFFSRGDLTYDNYSHYAYQWWYTLLDTNAWWSGGHYYGKIDFADSDSDGTVETWRELFEYWYDNGTSYTPSSY